VTEHSYAALRAHHQRLTGMYADPECVGELLLVGAAMGRSIDLGDPGWVDGSMPMKAIADAVYGHHWLPGQMLVPGRHRGDDHPRKRIRSVFFADRRRYDPDSDPDATQWAMLTCGRPMVRRDGLCHRHATNSKRLTDPATGLRSYVGACGQKACKAWLADLLERNRTELAANPAPTPAANTGGVLERHLPEIDWWAVWRHVDKNWSPPPEGRPFERPTLKLVVDGPVEDEVPAVTARPVLQVLEGGWR
jgi:hypothetical protein